MHIFFSKYVLASHEYRGDRCSRVLYSKELHCDGIFDDVTFRPTPFLRSTRFSSGAFHWWSHKDGSASRSTHSIFCRCVHTNYFQKIVNSAKSALEFEIAKFTIPFTDLKHFIKLYINFFGRYFETFVIQVNSFLFKIKSTLHIILILNAAKKLLFQEYVSVIQS